MKNAESILTSAGKFHIKLGLERVQEALDKLNNPQDSMEFIHVAGTNGKGSICAILNEILCENFRGKDVNIALFTSPHLFSYCERIKVNNTCISQIELDSYVKKISDLFCELTEFEILTVAAFLYFREKNVKYAIMEVGLGGMFDSTNVIKSPLCSVISTIDFDHTARLGNTIDEIAYQKAGIIKKNCPVVVGCDNKGYKVIKKYADSFKAPLFTVDNNIKTEFDGKNNFAYVDNEKYEFSLLGKHQLKNLSCVLEALKHLPFKIDKDVLKTALKNVRWKFRLEYDADKKLLIDGAHNPSGIKVLREFLDENFKDEKKTFIFGCLNNKDYETMLDTLVSEGDELYFYEFNYPCALKFSELPQNIRKVAKQTQNPLEIINTTKNLKVVCGSLYMLGNLFNPR